MRDTVAAIGNDCVGCRSCEQSCPKKCISMKEDTEGFLYPSIQYGKCVQCGVCLKKCPVGKPYRNERDPLKAYAFKEKDSGRLFNSASGGVSDAAVGAILERGGAAYGAAYDDELTVKHIEAIDEDGRRRLQSSKYVQSDLNDCYTRVKKQLEIGRLVLFTGTPCQVAGLYAYLGEEHENLYTIDLICHGVPSPKFFKKYLEWQGKQMGGRVIYYNFRSKEKRGWGTQYLIKTRTKAKTKTLSLDRYGKHFMAGDCYRESCYQCGYANIHHPADITAGDFWGVEQRYPEFASRLGVSAILINSKKGELLLEMIRDYAEIIEISIEDALIKQGNLKHPTLRAKARDEVYREIDTDQFIDNLKVGLQTKERVKALLPAAAVRLIKRGLKK